MSDDNPYVIPEMDPTLRKQIQECNWQVVNVTTPANYFHVLRRQVSGAISVMNIAQHREKFLLVLMDLIFFFFGSILR
jgi:hypothetical protein